MEVYESEKLKAEMKGRGKEGDEVKEEASNERK